MNLPKIGGTQAFSPTLTGGGGKARSYIEKRRGKRCSDKRRLESSTLILPDPEETNELLIERSVTWATRFRIFLKYFIFFFATSFVWIILCFCIAALFSFVSWFLSSMIDLTGVFSADPWPYVAGFCLYSGPFLITGVQFYRNAKYLGPSHGCY